MSQIKLLNPSDLGIMHIARKFNSTRSNVNLLNLFRLAVCENDNKTRDFLKTERTLARGAVEIPSSVYLDYLYAVALAQRRIKREGDELVQLKRLINENFLKQRCLEVQKTFTDIGYAQGAIDLVREQNFFNYLIDKLIFISIKKEREFASGQEASLDIGNIDTEVTSNDNGFILSGLESEEVTDLLFEAAITPLHVNETNVS